MLIQKKASCDNEIINRYVKLWFFGELNEVIFGTLLDKILITVMVSYMHNNTIIEFIKRDIYGGTRHLLSSNGTMTELNWDWLLTEFASVFLTVNKLLAEMN